MSIEEVKQVIDSFDSDEAASIKKAQDSMSDANVIQDLSFLSAIYTFLVSKIDDLQQKESSMGNALHTLNTVEQKINSIPGAVGIRVSNKLKAVISKNTDLEVLRYCNKTLSGNEIEKIVSENQIFHHRRLLH